MEIAGEGKVWSEGYRNVFRTVLTENRVILAAEQVSFAAASISNKAHMTEKQHTMR